MRLRYFIILLVIIVYVIDIVISYRPKQSRQPKRSKRPKRVRQPKQNYEVRYFRDDERSGMLSSLVTWNPKKHRFVPMLNSNGKMTKRYKHGIYIERFKQDRNGMMNPIYVAVHKPKEM
jgi:hypothetical protein